MEPHILDQATGGDLDEVAREDALSGLRRQNFQLLAEWIVGLFPRTMLSLPKLLDVGCAHGWFLEAMSGKFVVYGIEPDPTVAAMAKDRGLPVRIGFFPDMVDADERFDVIAFNDVLEHIEDINSTLAVSVRHLAEGGMLVINAPSRRGAIYRVSKLLARMGRDQSFRRMWQFDFPSPHLHYLDTTTIDKLASRHGLVRCANRRLPSITVRGLFSRIRYSKDISITKAILLTVAVAISSPLLGAFPPDIEVWVLKARDRDAVTAW